MMTFDQWFDHECGPDWRASTQASHISVLRGIAGRAWHAGGAAVREEMLTRWNRAGLDIDAALHGRVNEKSPIAGRLRMIAAKQPQWRPIKTAPKDGTYVLLACAVGFIPIHCGRWRRSGDEREPQPDEVAWRTSCCGRFASPTHWMPLPPAPEEVATGEKEQEARDVTE